MLNLITLMACGVIVFSITSYEKCDEPRYMVSVFAYLLAFISGAHAINVAFMQTQADLFGTALASVVAIATYRKRGNVACFFKES